MISFCKKLWRDKRGNALVIAAAALPLVLGSAGLASDTVEWALWKRQLQRAADSGAIAGGYAKLDGRTVDNCSALGSATYSTPVAYDVQKNNHSGITTTCTATNPPSTGAYTADTNAVRVSLTGSHRLSFSGLFMSATPTITATATATLIDTGSYCVVALNKTSTPGITVGGSATANLGCGAISNSTSTTSSVNPNGGTYSFVASPVASVGGMPSSINGATNLQPYHVPEPDPFAGKYPTDVPNGTTCKGFNQMNYGPQGTKLKAGCYTDFHLSGNKTFVMDPGVYYLDSCDFNVDGGVTLQGTGVTIILTGTNPGSLQINGNSTVQISAQTSGTYDKMLFIQKAGATPSSTVNGTAASNYDGAMYFPSTGVSFTGTAGSMTKCAMVVAYTVDFSGNTNLQNDTSGCTANKQVTAKKISLVE
jgi:hypothetical protein